MTSPFVKANRRYDGPGWFNKPGIKVIGIPSGEAFGNPTVALWQFITVTSGIPSAEALGAIMLAYNQFVTVASIASVEALGAQTLSVGPVNVAPSGIASGEAFGSNVIGVGPVSVAPSGIASGEAVGNPTVASPPNMMLDPTFEIGSPTYLQGSSDRTTEQARTGTYSFKLVSITTQTQLYFNRPPAGNGPQSYADLAVGDVFYLEFYIKANASNVKSGLAITAAVAAYDSNLANPAYPAFAWVYTTDVNSTGWTKVTGLYRHTDATRTKGFFYLYTNAAVYADSGTGDSWYIDDVQLIRTQELSVSIPVDNDVTDPSVEIGMNTASDGWSQRAVVYRTAQAARSGSYSMKLEPSTTVDANATFPMPGGLGSVIPTYPGEIWEIEFWYMAPISNAITVVGTPHFAIRNATTLVYSYPNMPAGGFSVPADGVWRRYTTTYTVPANTDMIRATVNLAKSQNPNVIYIDDASVRRLAVPAPSVDMVLNPLAILDNSELATDPTVQSPWWWRGTTQGVLAVTQDSGVNVVQVTNDTAGEYARVIFTRDKNGNDNSLSVNAGDTLNISVDVKYDIANTGSVKTLYLQCQIYDTINGVNPAITNQVSTIDGSSGNWVNLSRTVVIPAGYDTALIFTYIHNGSAIGDRFYAKNFHIDIVPASDHAITVGPVNVGTVNVSPPAIDTAEAFGSHTLFGDSFISMTGLSDSDGFGAHTVSPGAVNITTTAISDTDGFGTHAITTGNVNVAPSGIASGEAFGSNTVVPGDVSVAPSAIADTDGFGSHTVFAAFTETDTPRTNQPKPVGITGLWITGQAAGGGSGGGADGAFGSRSGGAGGGAGATLFRSFIPAADLVGSTYSVSIGSRGSAGARVGASDGTAGGDAGDLVFSCGANSITLGGGKGGAGGPRSTAGSSGGAGGVANVVGFTGLSTANGTAGANGNDSGTTVQNAANNGTGAAGGGGGGGRNSGGAGRAGGSGGDSPSQTGANGGAAGANNGGTPSGTVIPGAGGGGGGGVGGGGTAGTGGAGGNYGGGAGGGGGGDNGGNGNQGGLPRIILEWV